jgi:tartrate-resistant acid phosphatase type 5
VFFFGVLSFVASGVSFGQNQSQPEAVALSEAIIHRLPAAYRDEARKFVTAALSEQQTIARSSDEHLAIWTLYVLADQPGCSRFVLAQLEKEPSPKLRSAIISALSHYWVAHPASQKVLEQHATRDADADVALAALNELRDLRMQELGKLLNARLKFANKMGDSSGAAKLSQEQERRFNWYGELALPGFLRVPPPMFSVVPADKAIRVLSFGDFGTGSPEQMKLAKAMVEYHKFQPFDFGITLGDNFYPIGMNSPSDPRWQSQWEQLYGPMGIKFYPSFGNHDYGQSDSPAAELLYSEKSPDWRFPAPYYTYMAGTVQFFAIDNINLSEAQLQWLSQELAKSQAPWKVVYGHYHIYSATRGDNQELIKRLLPILEKYHVQVYLNGHDHNLQEVRPQGGVHFFVSGGGGATLYDLKDYPRSIFKQKINGFTVLEADASHFKISFVNIEGKEIYQQTLTR